MVVSVFTLAAFPPLPSRTTTRGQGAAEALLNHRKVMLAAGSSSGNIRDLQLAPAQESGLDHLPEIINSLAEKISEEAKQPNPDTPPSPRKHFEKQRHQSRTDQGVKKGPEGPAGGSVG